MRLAGAVFAGSNYCTTVRKYLQDCLLAGRSMTACIQAAAPFWVIMPGAVRLGQYQLCQAGGPVWEPGPGWPKLERVGPVVPGSCLLGL